MNKTYLKEIIRLRVEETDYDSLHIAFGVDNNYLRFACVTMLSIIKHTKKKVCFHIFCDHIDADDIRKLKKIVECKDDIDIICYLVDDSSFKDFPQGNGWNLSIYYRAIAPYVLEEKVDKVLYLDADILCLRDVSELFAVDIDDVVAAVVKDGISEGRVDKRLELLGMDKDAIYFTAGVMLINVYEYNRLNTLSKFVDVINEKKEELFFFDQDALNLLLCKNVIFVDDIFNFQVFDKTNKQPCLVHFAGVRKPWFRNFDYYYFDDWRSVFFELDWGRELACKKSIKPSEYRYQSEYHFNKGNYLQAIKDYGIYLLAKMKKLFFN